MDPHVNAALPVLLLTQVHVCDRLSTHGPVAVDTTGATRHTKSISPVISLGKRATITNNEKCRTGPTPTTRAECEETQTCETAGLGEPF